MVPPQTLCLTVRPWLIRTCDVACHVLVHVCMYTTRTQVKICQLIRCTPLLDQRYNLYKFCGISIKGSHLSLRVPVRNYSE